ncbi:M2 family metallopeptidase [Pseudoxanthomonas mexicana]|uniref:M2 family metallopeptidase n=1 Tax=Pseudoxanthomonas mexicana TaxID=128785 RepID=A0ABX6RBJ4_PSEMX|nr:MULTISPECIES: M2 family metallopeptidase [Pseudoxanthomonas]MCA0297985.1 M2 family metallopeptidase [Pseudomonadota bacterium]KAF1726819.1 peptidase M20 [Pseudoxanthomonas mexicana]MCH2091032.1 M2 family metallopeptidase [Pseudoxanthomonas sp.]QLQ29721.1 MAG: M2 family metallopeptidase [Pseudoxanthomonas sp.]QND80396.1 M2 family metallopeptidase [Pseudoxanthomonas mexicana]
MKHRHLLLALAIGAGLVTLAACKKDEPATDSAATPAAPKGETADQFIARVNDEFKKMYPEMTAAQWLSSTYINDDSQLLAAKGNERYLTQLNSWIEQAKKFEGQQMSPETARAIQLLKLATAMPAPKDPAKLAELTQIATRMEGTYGAGTYCTGEGDAKKCRQLGELEDVLRSSRDYDAQLDAWQGWHTIAQPMRKDYTRFVELVNEGSKEMGFADTGEMWRSGYDMTPAEIAAETDRLWGQVKPLYEQLHCYTRTKLQATYGVEKGQVNGLLPAHLMGNMWQQDWGNLWDMLEPYKGAGSLDITGALEKQYQADYQAALAKAGPGPGTDKLFQAEREAQLQVAKQMTERAQDFYTSLGMPKLPESYWTKTQFIKPMDRDVVCHASAWDMNMSGDVRTKMCIKPNEEDFTTIYHELGHVYYYLAYNKLPPLFQTGAHDGFHEAIGDTMVLAMTPDYLKSIGMVGEQQQSNEALINAQMRMALAKVSFMPFGLMIDRWRWGVFDGSIKPADYNKAWWELKAKYQGVAPATARGEDFFDPGAKYHVPGNTPYTRYFLSHVLQFQFYKGLCDAAGYKGPLYNCSFYGNKAAGQKFWAMLEKGASQPWQATLKELTGGEKMDAGAVLEYFAPLQDWLKQQNEGQTCGWPAAAPVAAAAPAKP